MFTKFCHRYTDLIRKVGCKFLINDISHPKFYGNIVLKTLTALCYPCKLIKSSNNLICKHYLINVVIKSLDIDKVGT